MRTNIANVHIPALLPIKYWGSASSGYQVEGGLNSNWTNDELARAAQLWQGGKNPDDYICGIACQFDTRYPDDMLMAKGLGHNAIRFGIGWDKVEPMQGIFDEEVLTRVEDMVSFAQGIGLEKIVFNFYHWTHPMWFEESGGWKRDDAPELFAKFVDRVHQRVYKYVDTYTVINEPNVYANFSYRWGIWPPHEEDEAGYQKAIENIARGHELACKLIKRWNIHAKIGIAQAAAWKTSDDPTIKAEMDKWNFDFTDRIRDSLDFVGINVYFDEHHPKGGPDQNGFEGKDACTDHPVVSDMNWAMCPRALYEVAKEFHCRYSLPMMVTEHGHAVGEFYDDRRCWYIWESLKWLHKLTVEDKIPLIGYLHWSLLDNFEWAYGWGPKFGLIHVDRATQKRTPRASAHLLRDIIAAGALTQEIADKYKDVIKHPHE